LQGNVGMSCVRFKSPGLNHAGVWDETNHHPWQHQTLTGPADQDTNKQQQQQQSYPNKPDLVVGGRVRDAVEHDLPPLVPGGDARVPIEEGHGGHRPPVAAHRHPAVVALQVPDLIAAQNERARRASEKSSRGKRRSSSEHSNPQARAQVGR